MTGTEIDLDKKPERRNPDAVAEEEFAAQQAAAAANPEN